MKIIHTPQEAQSLISKLKTNNETIGFVPTMGALHEGHISLIKESAKENSVTIVSIFVNPKQFGEGEDLETYPRTFDDDLKASEKAGASIVFAPSDKDMYPSGFASEVSVTDLSKKLEGKIRPDHFSGVTTVVLKLFNSVLPDIAYFGQKDAQQAIIIKKMVRDLNVPVKIKVMPIIRDSSGLALSSRNRYLTEDEFSDASLINKGLNNALLKFNNGERSAKILRSEINSVYNNSKTFCVEYIVLVNTVDLEPVDELQESTLVAVAVKTTETKTRLIDNIIIGKPL